MWSSDQGHETVNFGVRTEGRRSRSHDAEVNLEARQNHHVRPRWVE